MSENLTELYNEDFYNNLTDGTSKSAEIVLSMLFQHFKPQSIIDMGCAQGGWLATAESLGTESITGVDGEWVDKEKLLSKNILFKVANFSEHIPKLDERYDLCISLEVAEHIPEKKAGDFIKLLCGASDTVLFSAAIKHQGGTNHINEQWQSYWIELFKANGYDCYDLFRKKLWNNNSVESWYRQNILLFSKRNNPSFDFETLASHEEPVLDLAHPIVFENKINYLNDLIENPTLLFCMTSIKRYIKNKLVALTKKTKGSD